MIFSSFQFIYIFLPIVFFLYWICIRFKREALSQKILILASLFFYGYYNPLYLPIILGSMIVNFFIGNMIANNHVSKKGSYLLWVGILFNLALLGYFKYIDFAISNINFLLGSNWQLANVALPLAISFFTFQQISYLVDSKEGLTRHYSFYNYSLFVCFFPQLIAGPIVHHSEMMPQFKDPKNLQINYRNIVIGIFIFSIGLFKKVVLADYFAKIVRDGYASDVLTTMGGWYTSIGYSFQLYFDFSGYCDMAIGLALFFNIKLPINFDSPYKSKNIQEFWRRWHITLGRFIRDYIYIKLGGNKGGQVRVCVNIIITFLLAGLWHGASWMFVIWGFLHGIALVVHRVFSSLDFKMHDALKLFTTLMFVNFAWIFFRSPGLEEASRIIYAMLGIGVEEFGSISKYNRLYIATLTVILLAPNSIKLLEEGYIINKYKLIFYILVFLYAVKTLLTQEYQEFIYYNF